MKKQLLLIIVSILIISVFFCGCQETESVKTDKKNDNIYFESNVVALKQSDLILHEEEGKIIRAEVIYLFRNLLKEQVNLEIKVEFYDKNDNLLHIGGPKYIDLIPQWSEVDVLGANSIAYSGEFARMVDHVIIIAERIN